MAVSMKKVINYYFIIIGLVANVCVKDFEFMLFSYYYMYSNPEKISEFPFISFCNCIIVIVLFVIMLGLCLFLLVTQFIKTEEMGN